MTNDELILKVETCELAITNLVTHSGRLAEALRISMENTLAIVKVNQTMYQQHVDYMQILDTAMNLEEPDDSTEDN